MLFTVLIMAVVFMGSCMMIDNSALPWVPWVLLIVSGLWLYLFVYANLRDEVTS